MKDKDLLQILKKNGWSLARISGSHHVLQKYGKATVIFLHGKDVSTNLLSSPQNTSIMFNQNPRFQTGSGLYYTSPFF